VPDVTSVGEPDPLRAAVDAAIGFFRDIEVRQWDAAAARVDPDAATRFRETALAVFSRWAATRASRQAAPNGPVAFGVGLGGTADPSLVEQYGATPLRGVRGVSTLGELAGLTPAQLVARSLEYQGGETPDGPDEAVTREVLAAVAEGALAAQVVYRRHRASMTTSWAGPVERLGMTLRDGRWFVDLERMHVSLARLLRDNMHGQPPGDAAGPAS